MRNFILYTIALLSYSCNGSSSGILESKSDVIPQSMKTESVNQEEIILEDKNQIIKSHSYTSYLNPFSYSFLKDRYVFNESSKSRDFTVNAKSIGLQKNRYYVTVRLRPILTPGLSKFATHGYIAKIDNNNKIIETLSFDPSNSIGSEDAQPSDASWGEVMVGTDVSDEAWEDIKQRFLGFSHSSRGYSLRKRNCCHAVMNTLANTGLSILENKTEGIKFAYWGNQTWNYWASAPSLQSYLDISDNVK